MFYPPDDWPTGFSRLAGQDKSLDEVKVLLRNNIHATFGTEITDRDLSGLSCPGRCLSLRSRRWLTGVL
jgi:hypothetical protein